MMGHGGSSVTTATTVGAVDVTQLARLELLPFTGMLISIHRLCPSRWETVTVVVRSIVEHLPLVLELRGIFVVQDMYHDRKNSVGVWD